MSISKVFFQLARPGCTLGATCWRRPSLSRRTRSAGCADCRCSCPGCLTMDKGDNTWMLVSSALVLLMTVPGLALFYGGLVRAKNMLSVLMQVFMITAVVSLIWVATAIRSPSPTAVR